ncbi:uncharacterized protein CDAR_73501 [Caerostris darwini]|uniref:Uncharacterized protein n=1 Tax=Caerostris darwini TaxID=1538125 RepID=A0AAV4VLV4_9ARAC|nr:uncharacterized protein CDAR_73501 [Caerostris darwini]
MKQPQRGEIRPPVARTLHGGLKAATGFLKKARLDQDLRIELASLLFSYLNFHNTCRQAPISAIIRCNELEETCIAGPDPGSDPLSGDPVQSFKNNLAAAAPSKRASTLNLKSCSSLPVHRTQILRGNMVLKVVFGLFLWATLLTASYTSEVAENLTETADADDAEFRQGGIAQQLMSSYPGVSMGNLYGGNAGGYQLMGGAGAGTTGGGGFNMLRNLYRPPSFGLTDKVKHWVKSFMNRRQYIKPYYNPTGGLSYAPSEYGAKPMFGGANGYKAISVPLRQLQKYYKPYYAAGEGGSPQYMQSAAGSAPGSAGASSFVSYSPSAGGVGSSNGLYASESASSGHFTGGSSGFEGASALYGAGAPASSGLFSPGGSPSSGLFSSGNGPNSGLFSGAGGSSGIFSGGDGSMYYGSNDGGSSGGLYGSDGGSSYFSANSGAGGYGSSGSASSLLASLNSGSNGGNYGDLYASGASPSAALYNPSNGDNGRNYGNSNNKQPSYTGAGSSALYISSDDRSSESYPSSKSSNEHTNSFNVDSARNSETYSVSFQPAQSKSYSAGFQPVSYSADSGNTQGFQEKSSS